MSAKLAYRHLKKHHCTSKLFWFFALNLIKTRATTKNNPSQEQKTLCCQIKFCSLVLLMYHKGQQSAANQRKRNDMYIHQKILVSELCCRLSLKSLPYSKKVVIRREHYFKTQRAAINQRRPDTREYKADPEKLNHHQLPT